jgi:UDP:flavonoid glycosyltransferase YjiC (YdhE family)
MDQACNDRIGDRHGDQAMVPAMKSRVGLLCYHGLGHINPCFPLARALRGHGHDVVFAGAAYFRPYVIRAGFAYHAFSSVPFGLGFEDWMSTQHKSRMRHLANLSARFSDRLYHEREREMLRFLDDVKPDVLLIDATQATDYIVLYPQLHARGIQVIMMHAMFPTHVLPGRPPANSPVMPRDESAGRQALNKMQRECNRKDLVQRLRYFGMSDRFLINRRMRRNKVPPQVRSTLPSLFDFQVAAVPELILAPREFDFPGFTVPAGHYYIGFMQNDQPPLPGDGYLQARSGIIQRKHDTGSRLVYCSFGTIGVRHQQVVDTFLLRLCRVTKRSGHILVISLGKHEAPAELQGDHVYVFTSVPQTDLLGYTDIFVTHGGLSSIKEAIDAVVPMLMVPVHTDYDPVGNAARVAFHGLGLRVDATADSEAVLAEKLDALLTDEQYRENIRGMKEKNAAYTVGGFLELFEVLMGGGTSGAGAR